MSERTDGMTGKRGTARPAFSGHRATVAGWPTLSTEGARRRLDVETGRMPRQIAKYDKWGGRTVVKAFKKYVFGNENIRLTRARCELFFENDSNFA